jgi:hypothetical protein
LKRLYIPTVDCKVLNKSMSDCLKLYQSHYVPGLEHCDATIKFTMIMNNMFDALNAKCPFEGVRPGSKIFRLEMCTCILYVHSACLPF